MKQFVIKNWRHLAVTTGLFACLLVGSYLTLPTHTSPAPHAEVLKRTNARVGTPSVAAATSRTPTASATPSNTAHAATASTAKNTSQTVSSTPTGPSRTTPQQTPSATTVQPTSFTVSLQINGKSTGDVSIAATASQCDVLRAALAQGVITSLDMRYFASLASYGVYAINGQGDSNQVWWVYSVNGKSPPVGCSKLGVSSGEIINWQYTGK